MSDYTQNQLRTLKEDAEMFSSLNLNWLSNTCRKEHEIISNEIKQGIRN